MGTQLTPGPHKTVTFEATDLDIRDLDSAQDSVEAVITEPIDPLSGAVRSITQAHYEVHKGDHYTFSAYTNPLNAAATLEFIVTTPDTTKWAHMVFGVAGALETLFEVFETTTHTIGVAQSTFNNNRNSSNVATTLIHASVAGGTDGTLLPPISFGVDAGSGNNLRTGGGSARGDNEWILKQNTKYLVRATSGADANNVTIILSWYEHTGSA